MSVIVDEAGAANMIGAGPEPEQQVNPYQRFFGSTQPSDDPEINMLRDACAGFLEHFTNVVASRGGAPKLIMDAVGANLLQTSMLAVKALSWNK